MKRHSKKIFFVVILLCIILASAMAYLIFFVSKAKIITSKNNATLQANQNENEVKSIEPAKAEEKVSNKLSSLPEEVKALYLTGWTAGSAKKMEGITVLIEKEKLNSVVIDIKDYSGYISYNSSVEEVLKYNATQKMIKDVDALIKDLHEKNIYAVARITVFQDPVLAKARPDLAIKNKATGGVWKDRKSLAWIDPASTETWNYIVKIAREASDMGFDEINFDYVRFPSDGSLGNMSYPFYDSKKSTKREVIKEFFSYLNANLKDVKLSVDLFGLSTVNKDDLGIGQVIEDAYGNFDFVSPMVYPSHYASGFQGFKNPAAYPYEVVKYSMEKAKIRLDEFNGGEKEEGARESKLRPWFQAFDMGATYGPEKIKAQMKANNEAGGVGWILWNPSNVYASRIAGINK